MSVQSLLSTLAHPLPAIRMWKLRAMAERIISRSDELTHLDDIELTTAARRIRWRAQTGTPLRVLLPESFALVRETSRRVLGMAHFPVQIMGGMALLAGQIVEMQTGEGKTLTAALPAFLQALTGLGCHVLTSNDYLAGRDMKILAPLYERLGLTVGHVSVGSTPKERREAYASDITYGTAQEMGFDFLRDRLQKQPGSELAPESLMNPTESTTVQRGHHFALIDEADSILIDEGRTPLVIGLVDPNEPATVFLYRWSRRTIRDLKRDVDFEFDPQQRTVELTPDGCRKILLRSKSALLSTINTDRIYLAVEQALIAELGFQRDRDYVVVKDEVQIVDESTGRIMDGRKWQQGLHQSIEAKERLAITPATGEAARITMQSYFRLYTAVAGMTGTARPARRELKYVYNRSVVVIPTHRPCLRQGLPTRIFATLEAKRRAVVDEIAARNATGQPLLVGTPSVAASIALGEMLQARGLAFQLLNAYEHEREAGLVQRAGDVGQITIATNMAGRGTDIHIGDEARVLGGLHVIATEMHSSIRIDRQLIGRAARQGDPGSFQFWLSLEDELLHCLTPELLASLRRKARPTASGEVSAKRWLGFFRRTQKYLEKLQASQRRELLVQEKRRVAQYHQMGLDPCLELTEA